MTAKIALKQKIDRFLSATKFAVVGASADAEKYGFKTFKFLLDNHKDVVPINPNETEVLGIKCLQTLSQLPDPTHTAVCIVIHPEETLKVVEAAKTLGIFALWLSPGAEDDAVVKFMHADSALDERCVYQTMAVHEHKMPPTRTRSKPDTTIDLPAPNVSRKLSTDTTPPCLLKQNFLDVAAPAVAVVAAAASAAVASNVAAAAVAAAPSVAAAAATAAVVAAPVVVQALALASTLEQKATRFLFAPKFAVVGASTNASKNGAKCLQYLVKHNKDVVPINLKATEIQGLKCLQSLSQLPDPTHTSVSVVVPPAVTLDIVKQAKSLGIFSLWLQAGAEDDEVIKFIEADPQFRDRCIYPEHPVHTSTLASKVVVRGPIAAITPPCLFTWPMPVVTAEPASTPAPDVLGAVSSLVAGVKRDMLSPPSTPPPAKALKLSPEDNTHVNDLGQEIPGQA